MVSPAQKSAVLVTLVVLCAVVTHVATFSHATARTINLTTLAAAYALAGTLPTLWFSRWIAKGAVRQLAVVLWRVTCLLPALITMQMIDQLAKSDFITPLLACYFVALTVESAMLIHEARNVAS